MRMRLVVVGFVLAASVPGSALAVSGIFRSAFTEITSANATGIVTGDFNNDQAVDVATVSAGAGGNEIDVLQGFDDGTLTNVDKIPVNSFPSGMLLADFDRDQVPDLVIALGNDNAVTFLKGRADQDFFDPPTTMTTVGTGPVAMASADLDGDGDRDLVVVNEGSDSAPGSVSILHGNGNGTFTVILQDDPTDPGSMVAELPAELGTRAVALGNIDGDPALDILALNSRSNSLSIFRGAGGGAFTPAEILPTGASPQDLKLVDLDGDAKLDLVIAESNEDAVAVRLGNGDRTFDAATPYATGTSPTRLAVGDLDDNGTLDIVASNARSGDVTLLRGDGKGGFGGGRSYVADAEPQALTLADLNDDGLLEPVVATQGGDGGATVAVLRNRGAGVLQAVEDIAAGNGPSALAVADVTDDGLPDLLATGDQGNVIILPALASGGFGTASTINVGGRGLGIVAVDLNGDARPDIAVVDNQNNRVAVALATGPGRFAATQLYPVAEAPGGITSGDFNDDGRPDLAVTAIGPPARVSALLQNADGTFASARSTVLTGEETPIGLAALDANCDGKDDLVVANQASNTVSVLRSNGDGTFAVSQTLPSAQVGQGPISVAAADFDRDGVSDFAVSNSTVPVNNPSVRVFKGDCGSGNFAPLSTARAGDVVTAIVARDFTGDQIVDIGLVNQTLNDVRVLTGKGDGTFSVNTPDAVSRMPIAIAAADFDGDGRYDASTANSDPSANNVSVLFNCARDQGCDPFRPGPPGSAALRGDANNDGIRSAADFVAVAAEVMDGDGRQVEAIGMGSFSGTRVSPGVDANGDGVVTAQDRRAVAHRIFGGA
ncbi:MAG TPA: VCBS repeat-containing protein [Candidatus Dormibacteraeota bacterium]|nr:VCBS repeat-containing protein [Candidatus Dormibacteraeota bacterium]